MAESVEAVVVGAGVIGLAIARALALAGREVIVIEAAAAIGTETSSRNSEVIHAGIYYAKGSLKARLCVSGKRMLYEYCRSHGIDHAPVGKLIVATGDDEVPVLASLRDKARANGIDDLVPLSGAEAVRIEPNLSCRAALFSPSTGLVDSHGLMQALLGDAEAEGAALALRTPFVGAAASDRGISVVAGGEGGRASLDCRFLVNAAGLGAQAVALAIAGLHPGCVPRRYLAKGSYFSLTGPAPFARLIYPVPGTASLGLHFTRDRGGRGKFGPDVEWVETIDYDVDPARADAFYAAVRRYYPGLKEGALTPDYAGVRPKIQAPGEPAADFRVDGPAQHGVAGLVNLFGIESPGLTSCLAIAEHVVHLLA